MGINSPHFLFNKIIKMLYRKINKLNEHKSQIQARIISAYESDADTDVIAVRVSDLEVDLSTVDQNIYFEYQMIKFKVTLLGFSIAAVLLLILSLLNKLP